MRYAAKLTTAVVTLLLVALAAPPAMALDSDPVWSDRETAALNGDYTQHVASDRYLAYDHYGTPGIVYHYAYNDYIYFRRRVEGAGWNTGMSFFGAPGTSPTLVYDRHERPVIGYVDQGNTNLGCFAWNGTSWVTNWPDTDAKLNASLALDQYGRAAMVYRRASSDAIRFIYDTDGDGDWTDETAETVNAGWSEYGYPRLAFDAQNRPVVAFWLDQGANTTLAVTVRDTGTWYSNLVDSTNTTHYNISLAIDPDNGYPAVAYNDSAGNLKYAAWDNQDGWLLEDLGKGALPSLAFDPADGAPVIACTGAPGGDEFLNLYYLDSDDLKWREQVVDPEADVGYAPSLAFNPYGDKPLGIAYFSMSGTLYYIQDPPVVPEPATLGLLAVGLGALLHRRRRSAGRT